MILEHFSIVKPKGKLASRVNRALTLVQDQSVNHLPPVETIQEMIT